MEHLANGADLYHCAYWAVPKRDTPSLTVTIQSGVNGAYTAFAYSGVHCGVWQSTLNTLDSAVKIEGDAEL